MQALENMLLYMVVVLLLLLHSFTGISTPRSVHSIYLVSVREKRREGTNEDISSLPFKKHGRPLLGERLDLMVQKYLKKES